VTLALRSRNGAEPAAAERRVGLVTRVSTERQAMTEEGSLKNQLQRLRAHIEYKVGVCGEGWKEAALYELKAVSGKDALRSADMQRLFADIVAGRVNTVLCTALDRISRSVSDFLRFFEILNEYGVEFVCLKQNYDTTSPQGKLFITIMMALAQFEREQTSERTRDATAARADRGLWNGGRLLGYDLDPDRKGYPIPNVDEVALVNFAFDTYLVTGSIKTTMDTMNVRGYRTKSYTSRRGVHHAGTAFTTSSVQYLLKNPAYIGRKEINKSAKVRGKREYKLVDAVWPGIVDVAKFEETQRLMASNGRSNHNGATPVRHAYVLSGILHCGRCSGPMEGRSGTGRLGVKYFYYACRNGECSLKVTALEVEDAVLDRLGVLAREEGMLPAIVAETNRLRSKELPSLQGRLRSLQKKLTSVRTSADKVLAEWSAMDAHEGRAFLNEKLGELAQQREQLEQAVVETEDAVLRAQSDVVQTETVREALANIGAVYGQLRPAERKELMQLVLRRVEVNERQIVLEIYGGACATIAQAPAVASNKSGSRSEAPNWLPGQDSNLQPIG
jgi:site-specific DNA recombinase